MASATPSAAARPSSIRASGSEPRPSSQATTASRLSAVCWRPPRARAVSGPLASGTMSPRPAFFASIATGNAPLTGFRPPLSESSPMNSYAPNRRSSTCADAARMPSAMGRSNRPPSLGRSAGASAIVTWPAGNWNPALRSAALTRSLASRTAVSGSPTIDMRGNPPPACTSTVTRGAVTPTLARL